MASKGLVTMMQKALGALALTPAATAPMILMLTLRRSSRVIPASRGLPAVTMTRSAPWMSL